MLVVLLVKGLTTVLHVRQKTRLLQWFIKRRFIHHRPGTRIQFDSDPLTSFQERGPFYRVRRWEGAGFDRTVSQTAMFTTDALRDYGDGHPYSAVTSLHETAEGLHWMPSVQHGYAHFVRHQCILASQGSTERWRCETGCRHEAFSLIGGHPVEAQQTLGSSVWWHISNKSKWL